MIENDDLSREVATLRAEVEILKQEAKELRLKTDANRRDADRFAALLDGDKSLGIKGLRERQDRTEETLAGYEKSKAMLKGGAIVAGAYGLGSGGAIVTLIAKVFGAG